MSPRALLRLIRPTATPFIGDLTNAEIDALED